MYLSFSPNLPRKFLRLLKIIILRTLQVVLGNLSLALYLFHTILLLLRLMKNLLFTRLICHHLALLKRRDQSDTTQTVRLIKHASKNVYENRNDR